MTGCDNFQLRGGEFCGNCGYHLNEHMPATPMKRTVAAVMGRPMPPDEGHERVTTWTADALKAAMAEGARRHRERRDAFILTFTSGAALGSVLTMAILWALKWLVLT